MLVIRVRGLRYRCYNPVHNTQCTAIDVQSGWMSNEMAVWLATISLLVLSSNYHQNVNHQSELCIIDCSHCHHWLYVSLCWMLKFSPLTFTPCSLSSLHIGLSSGHAHMNTCANVLTVTHITGCKVLEKWPAERTHFHMSQSCHLQAQGNYSLTEQSSPSLVTLCASGLKYCNTRV